MNLVSQMLTVPMYAATLEGNPSPTTVYRWINAGNLPQAVDVDGVWMVPEGTPRPTGKTRRPRPVEHEGAAIARITPTTQTIEVVTEPEEPAVGLTVQLTEYVDEFFDRPVAEYLGRLPGAVPIKLAAILLGRSQKYLIDHADRYEVEKNGGPRGSTVVPRRVIMAEYGL